MNKMNMTDWVEALKLISECPGAEASFSVGSVYNTADNISLEGVIMLRAATDALISELVAYGYILTLQGGIIYVEMSV